MMESKPQNQISLLKPQVSSSNLQELNIKAKQTCKNLYLSSYNSERTYLHVYNTECEKEDIITLDTSEQLDDGTAVAQLPDGELFCFGRYNPVSGITLIVDKNYRVRVMPSGNPVRFSSAIYFDRSVYCFGGYNDEGDSLNLSERYDLDKNCWIKLTQMPKPDIFCKSIVFNGNILICGFFSKNIFLYSIDLDSFSILPYNKFASQKGKILVNPGKLVLIECAGFIYESEYGDEYSWKPIIDLMANYHPHASWTYNNRWVYIGSLFRTNRKYFKFNLNKKEIVEL